MSKLIDEPIKVHQKQDSTITAFIWRKRLYRVIEVLDRWREPCEWWNEGAVRLCFRVSAGNTGTGIYELYQVEEEWFLSRVLD
jgi:hypothetical protein